MWQLLMIMCNNIMIDDRTSTKLVRNVLLLSRDVMFYVIGVVEESTRIVAAMISR